MTIAQCFRTARTAAMTPSSADFSISSFAGRLVSGCSTKCLVSVRLTTPARGPRAGSCASWLRATQVVFDEM
jgi:hypothetical protein